MDLLALLCFATHFPKVPPSSPRIGACELSDCRLVKAHLLLTNQHPELWNALANLKAGGGILHNVGGKKISLVVVYREYDISGVYSLNGIHLGILFYTHHGNINVNSRVAQQLSVAKNVCLEMR